VIDAVLSAAQWNEVGAFGVGAGGDF